jgi:glycosyltransferase involved in cell wall biosynthesis
MKIAIISDRTYPFFKGGGEKRYWDIAKELTLRNHEVHFYTGQWPGMKKKEIIEGIHLHGVYKVKQFYKNGKKSIFESIKYTYKLFPALLKADYDIIDCEQMPLFSMFPAKLASIIKRKPLVLTYHEAWGNYWFDYLGKLKGLVGLMIEWNIVRLPKKIVSVSKETTIGLVKKLGVNPKKIITIPNGINIRAIEKASASKEKSDLIYVGRLLTHKNVDILINAIKYLDKNIKLIVVGEGPEMSKLKELVIRLDVEKRVVFKGALKDEKQVYALLKSSKVLVLPSSREGFGLTIVEANACGIPAITVKEKDNAAQKLIKEGKNGFICKLDEKSLSETLKKALIRSKSMKLDCIKESSKHDIKSKMDALLEVYEK